ncbi:MAG: hypothetical protein JXA96_13215 [Sedimentisphaerales bacterium]|nr:hypothetical protein [Sedimentisphaerales bacterium]
MTNSTEYKIGKAAAAVVLKSAKDEKAAITWITARRIRKQTKKRLSFSGSVVFDKKTAKHIEKDILPIVDEITELLDLNPYRKAYDISMVNPSLASVMNKRLEITGFSADVPVFLALLSAALNIPMAQNFVATGHIASEDGDVRPVDSLNSKIDAAKMTKGIERFILPAIDADISRKNWQQQELQQQADIIPYARNFFDMVQVSHLYQALPVVFSERDIIIASLENSYFDLSVKLKDEKKGNFNRILRNLTEKVEQHFWEILGSDANAGDIDNVRKMLLARIEYQIRIKQYPKRFGRKLLQIILAVPGTIRRIRLNGELIDIQLYFQLCQFADKDDLTEDSRYLRDVLEGRTGQLDSREFINNSEIEKRNPGINDLETIFFQISEDQLSKIISQPIDEAKANYILDKITVESAEQFFERITSFYIHLISHTAMAPAGIDRQALESSALQLLQRAFSNNGGQEAALYEAINGYSGGMNFILNQLTEQFKFEQRTGHVNSVLSRIIDQTNIEERIEFTRKLLEYLRQWLPSEIRNRPASTLIDRYQEIIKAYVSSLDRLKQTFRRF